MVLSNLSNNMDVESRTMATMGDTLGGSAVGLGAGLGAGLGRAAVGGARPAFLCASASPCAFCALGRSPLTEPVRVQLREASWTRRTSATSWPRSASGFTPGRPRSSS